MGVKASRARLAILAMTALAAAAPSPSSRWLDVTSVEMRSRSVRLTFSNRSGRVLHAIDPKRWGLANFIKVGFDVAPLGRSAGEGAWFDTRPDLDGSYASVAWADIAEQVGRDLRPTRLSRVDLDLPPEPCRGHLEIVVLARRGNDWLVYRRGLSTRILLPGELPMALTGVLGYSWPAAPGSDDDGASRSACNRRN